MNFDDMNEGVCDIEDVLLQEDLYDLILEDDDDKRPKVSPSMAQLEHEVLIGKFRCSNFSLG